MAIVSFLLCVLGGACCHSAERGPATSFVVAEAERPAWTLERDYRAPLLPQAGAVERQRFARELHELLQAGIDSEQDALARARRHFEAARRLAADDPRPFVAYGLVLWRRHRYDEALRQFRLAAEVPGPAYLPARQARLWLTLARKDLTEGLEQAVELAALLDAAETTATASPAATASARWLGRVFGFLRLPENELGRDAEFAELYEERVRRRLSARLQQPFVAGAAAVERDHRALQQTLQQVVAQWNDKQLELADTKQEQIDRERKQRQDEVEQLEMTAENWKTWIAKQLETHDESLKELTESFGELAAQAERLSVSMAKLTQELNEIDRRLYGRGGGDRRARELEQARAAVLAARDQLQARSTVLDRRAADVRQRGLAVQKRRDFDLARYRNATGQLIAESDTLQNWNELLNRKQQALGQPAAATSPAVRAAQRKVTALSSYVPFDLAVEMGRLSDALAADLKAIGEPESRPVTP